MKMHITFNIFASGKKFTGNPTGFIRVKSMSDDTEFETSADFSTFDETLHEEIQNLLKKCLAAGVPVIK